MTVFSCQAALLQKDWTAWNDRQLIESICKLSGWRIKGREGTHHS